MAEGDGFKTCPRLSPLFLTSILCILYIHVNRLCLLPPVL